MVGTFMHAINRQFEIIACDSFQAITQLLFRGKNSSMRKEMQERKDK